MVNKSIVTGRVYDTDKVVYIANLTQAGAYMNSGAANCLVDILYSTIRPDDKNKLIFVFEKNEKTKTLYKLWNEHKLVY